MATEIEHKYLTISNEWRENAKGILYVQGYLSNDKDRVVRVRLAGDQGYITIKGASEGASRAEYEYKIPAKDAREMLDKLCLPGIIEKTRYRVPFGGLTWEVDEFAGANKGLIVAEVELPAADTPVTLPPWVGKDVTHDPRYYNAELSKMPYSKWKQDAQKCQLKH
jgi:adenylate cyclase